MGSEKRGELLMILGGILLFAGNFLTFIEVGGVSFKATDELIDNQASSYMLAGGAAIIFGGLLWSAVKGATGRKVISIIALLWVGFFGLYAGIVDYKDVSDAGEGASVGIGMYVLIVGAILAVVGSILTLKATPSTTSAPPAA